RFPLEVTLELVVQGLSHDGGSWWPPPNAAVFGASIGRNHGMNGPADQFLLFQLAFDVSLVVGCQTDVHAGVIVAGSFHPQGRVTGSGLAACIRSGITGDISGKELVFSVLPVLLSDFFGTQTGGDSPLPSIPSPDRCNPYLALVRVGSK